MITFQPELMTRIRRGEKNETENLQGGARKICQNQSNPRFKKTYARLQIECARKSIIYKCTG